MANEATITSGLYIKGDNLEYQCRPQSFRADVTGRKGPTPGAVSALTTGTVIDLSQLTTPGLCRLQNLSTSTTAYVEWGIYDPQINVFFPLGEMKAGESYVIRFSRNLLEEYTGTGTGTTGPTNKFMLKASGAACDCLVEAFEV